MCSFRFNPAMKLQLLLSFVFVVTATTTTDELLEVKAGEFWPVEQIEYKGFESISSNDSTGIRRRLTPFQLCLPCKCCAATTCATMPCCFGIDCQLPNKPYGVCAFVPKTCNCTSCAV